MNGHLGQRCTDPDLPFHFGLCRALVRPILVAVFIDIWGVDYLTLHLFLGMLTPVMVICGMVV